MDLNSASDRLSQHVRGSCGQEFFNYSISPKKQRETTMNRMNRMNQSFQVQLVRIEWKTTVFHQHDNENSFDRVPP
jgi:hypothetical protein